MGSGEIQPWNNPLTMKQGVDAADTSQTNPSSGKATQNIYIYI
jgi:hypothetical protein